MNKVYALKYCMKTRTFIAVSELSVRIKKGSRRVLSSIATPLIISTALLISADLSVAATVSSEIPYQTFRDFSENKGRFKAGTNNIKIYDQKGKQVGILDKVPMMDFSSLNTDNIAPGVATLLSSQYIGGVAHNRGYQSVGFGDGQYLYQFVARNDFNGTQPLRTVLDFHVPRLNKLVTEVVPIDVGTEDRVEGAYSNRERYTAFYRAGSGTQYIQSESGEYTYLNGAYSYLTGGTIGAVRQYAGNHIQFAAGNIFDPLNGPLANNALAGDSGSGLFTYDSWKKKWIFIGVFSYYTGLKGTLEGYTTLPKDFIASVILKDNDPTVHSTGKQTLNWTFDQATGIGALNNITKTNSYVMHGIKDNDLNAGKNLLFEAAEGTSGHILLQDSVNQGAGSLNFKQDYRVTTNNNSTWIGAGLDIASNATVTWGVNGKKGDDLHKIGMGTLLVNAKGKNEGGLRIGAGTVILKQQPDRLGNVQAFSHINLNSGRGRVILGDNRQINPDNIVWGYRGGILDVKGNSLTFHKINTADFGAILMNSKEQMANIRLDFELLPDSVPIHQWGENNSTKGIPGTVYQYKNNHTGTTDYFLLKRENYWYFPVDQTDNVNWKFLGHSLLEAQTFITEGYNKNSRIFHGQWLGHLNILNSVMKDRVRKYIFDGSIDITGSLTKLNGRLTLQGHPEIHAYNSQNIVDILREKGDTSVSTQPTLFTQDDWENRIFRLGALNLTNVDFGLGRNATLETVITAYLSKVTLGDSRVFIDKNDGDAVEALIEEGESIAQRHEDKSLFRGQVFLYNNTELTINELFSGKISSYSSKVKINSADTILTGQNYFENSILQLNKNAQVLVTNSLFSNKNVDINNAKLYLHSMPTLSASHSSVELYTAQNWNLKGKEALLSVGAHSALSGNIFADDEATIVIGDNVNNLKPYTEMDSFEKTKLFYLDSFRNIWNGKIDAPKAKVSLYGTRWGIRDHSRIKQLELENSLIGFSDTGNVFHTLTVDHFVANNSGISLRYRDAQADKLVINHSATGQNNVLYVEMNHIPSWWNRLNVALINAPADTESNLFRTSETAVGFSRYLPVVTVSTHNQRKEWILTNYKFVPSYSDIRHARSFLNIIQNHFLSEVNNLNKRMGELRNINAPAGAWARITNSAGSGEGGYKDRYTLLQMGADRQYNFDNARLFSGVTVTYTDSKANTSLYSGKTDSVGLGLYASTLFKSGAYFDVIAKYVHHNNRYDLYLNGAANHHFNSHSLYAGAELGYRYSISDTLFLEPQAELVWGHIQGNSFNWVDNHVAVSMRRDSTQPLIGRTGLVIGKTMAGSAWSMTTRAGLHYEFDLTKSATTHFRDEFTYARIKGEKDNRMLMNIGINGEIAENKRFGLEAGTSVFGKYNINHEINLNFRYSF